MDPTEQQQQKSTILRIRLKLSQNAAEIQRNKVVISTQKKNRSPTAKQSSSSGRVSKISKSQEKKTLKSSSEIYWTSVRIETNKFILKRYCQITTNSSSS